MRTVSYVSCMHCNGDLTKEGKRNRCGGCHSVFYDNATCQKKDWAIHKKECKRQQRRLIAAVRPQYPEVDTIAELLAHSDACKIIVFHISRGEGGFVRNRTLSVFWMLQWVKGGDPVAMTTLGMAYTAELVPGKVDEGVQLLLRASAEVESRSECPAMGVQCTLGECYLLGRGIEIDFHEAEKWLRRAAVRGDWEAQTRLGQMLESGAGTHVEKNEDEALMWYRKAAGRRFSVAQFKLGKCYANGIGVAVDHNEAKKWLRLSADQGMEEAKAALRHLQAGGLSIIE
eukprot:TRINITY_DN867_c0_g1_i2.p1 TRINITY_DN867_c0_g1~~TRINITY_DN867_c0_g1_i2.p1  ORF type:complete len:286 (+),score=36.61 TRINITY_DN867_c0_g1_i2:71-928(+)